MVSFLLYGVASQIFDIPAADAAATGPVVEIVAGKT